MGEWDFVGKHFETLAKELPMLGRLWLFFMLVFRIVILGTVADDTFSDEQEEFTCNTLQPGCKQVCFNMAFPISMFRFWVFQIILIASPSLLFLLYRRFKNLYKVNLLFRVAVEVGFLVGQWKLYGFDVKEQFECERFPCPKIVDCFTSRPAEKTIFLHFYFSVGPIRPHRKVELEEDCFIFCGTGGETVRNLWAGEAFTKWAFTSKPYNFH
uniref:Uncharacterized protein n=1 Tax=Oryzias latipes TaxID=8090 RepID=A0A3B3IDI5_ORYLA